MTEPQHTSQQDYTLAGLPVSLISKYAALALVLHMLEATLPTLGPFKPGLANIVVLIVLLRHGAWPALTVSSLRLIAGALVMGTLLSPRFALAGMGFVFAAAALLAAPFLLRHHVSVIGVSILMAWLHMLGQAVMAALFFPQLAAMDLLPVMGISGIITGCITGLAALKLNPLFDDHDLNRNSSA